LSIRTCLVLRLVYYPIRSRVRGCGRVLVACHAFENNIPFGMLWCAW
jgi:hypothetical protein